MQSADNLKRVVIGWVNEVSVLAGNDGTLAFTSALGTTVKFYRLIAQ